MTGRFIAVVGPSGVGKDSVMAAMASQQPRLRLAQRVITRPSEAGGEVFNGVSLSAFETQRDAGGFALWWAAHGLCYGIPTHVDDMLAAGHDVLANLSRAMLHPARDRFDSTVIIALTARRDVLAQRLAARGREDAADIARRLARADDGLPEGVDALTLDNSGALQDTVDRALALLYPVNR